jgi:hypothetical protein
MTYGPDRGRGSRSGSGFGFRGSSPPYPYVGRGRGGLPRCSYPDLTRRIFPDRANPSFSAIPTAEEELTFLKGQSDVIKRQLKDIERRMQELEKKDEKRS